VPVSPWAATSAISLSAPKTPVAAPMVLLPGVRPNTLVLPSGRISICHGKPVTVCAPRFSSRGRSRVAATTATKSKTRKRMAFFIGAPA
jgi:hypothetical protein